jgi:hypothetical protein
MARAKDVEQRPTELPPLELLRVARLDEAARLAGMSQRTLRRNHSHLILRISPRRRGMRVGDALMLGQAVP